MQKSENAEGRKTERSHWDDAWQAPVRQRLPSRLNVGILNLTRLLARSVRANCRYLEIGCAPGKLLAWVAATRGARCTGLDYSETGIANCRALFANLRLDIELHQADFFDHGLGAERYDVVASFGFVEHFDDPAQVIARHLELAKPGGKVLIVVPNYGGIYGRVQGWCDPENLALHNIAIMSPRGLCGLIDRTRCKSVRAYRFGNVDPWLLNLDRKLPAPVARLTSLALNAAGLLQPACIPPVAPLLVLEVQKDSAR